jgi:small multidrug resistance family-3 protein
MRVSSPDVSVVTMGASAVSLGVLPSGYRPSQQIPVANGRDHVGSCPSHAPRRALGGAAMIIWALVLFVVAGFAEIGGGYLVWMWLRGGSSLWIGLLGGLVLFLYGVIPTLQPQGTFGRIYAAYGGIFVCLATLWGWKVDHIVPDRFDLIGAGVCLVGVAIIMWAPR